MATDFAGRARALVGTPFRPQGRSSVTGLDCIGLVMSVFRVNCEAVRRNYRLRGDHRAEIEAGLARYFRHVRHRRPGDVLLMQSAADQLHLAICTSAGFVHAHARIGRVVETPGRPDWPVLGTFRKRVRKARSD
jgi:cell wall-associated NlpC family hydrolase